MMLFNYFLVLMGINPNVKPDKKLKVFSECTNPVLHTDNKNLPIKK